MAGPVAQVVFSRASASSWRELVERYVTEVASKREGDDFWVSRMRGVGWSYDGTDRPFILDLDDRHREWTLPWIVEDYGEPYWTAASYEKAFGLLPDHAIAFVAMCNGDEDHYILGELVIAVAELLGGVIDMCGLVLPWSKRREVPGDLYASWDALQPIVQAFNASMPGLAVAATYETGAGRRSGSHTVDATFLRAWLQHPEFRMVK